MSRIRKKFRRGLAVFLSFCIVFTTFQSAAWANPSEDEEADSGQVRDALIELNGAKLLEEAEKAIQSGQLFDFEEWGMSFLLQDENGQLVLSEDYRKVLSSATGNVYAIDELPFVDEARAANALGEAWLAAFVKLDGEDVELEPATGSNAQKGTPGNAGRAGFNSAKKGSPSNAVHEDQTGGYSSYTMTGNEQFIFLFVNPSNDEINFQLDIDGRKTGILSVGRESVFLSGEEPVVKKEDIKKEPVKKDPVVPTLPAVPAGPGGAAGGPASPTEPVISTEPTASTESVISTEPVASTESGAVLDPTQEVPVTDPAESSPEDVTTEEGTEGITGDETQESGENEGTESGDLIDPTNSIDSEASLEDSGDSQVTEEEGSDDQQGQELPEENTDAGSEGGDTEDNLPQEGEVSEENITSSDNEGTESGENSAEEAPAPEENNDSGDAEPQNEEAGDNAPAEGGQEGAEVVAVSPHKVYRVGDSADEYIELENRNAEFEAWQEAQGGYDEEAEEEEYYSENVVYVNENAEGVQLETTILPTALMGMGGGAPMAVMSSEDEGGEYEVLYSERDLDMPTAGIMLLSARSLQTSEEAKLNLLKVNLYNYDANELNHAISGSTGPVDGNIRKDLFLINVASQELENIPVAQQNKVIDTSKYGGIPAAFQGIVSNEYDADGKISISDSYSVGGLGSLYYLFPDKEADVKEGVDAYLDIPVEYRENGNGVFQYKDGYYVLNAVEPGLTGNYLRDVIPVQVSVLGNEETGYALKRDNVGWEGFWPFEKITPDNEKVPRGGHLQKESFGMKMSFDFNMPYNGKGANGEDVKFTFVGDDDVWVYVRKQGETVAKLALDLGGVHGATVGYINFTTGEIVHTFAGQNGQNLGIQKWYLYNDKELDELNRGVGEGEVKYAKVIGLERPASGGNENYTLDFYFMERGGNLSSCYIDFNMEIIPKKEIKIQKKVVGDTDERSFDFKIISSDSKKLLEEYRNTQNELESIEDVKVETVNIKAGGQISKEISERYFYIQETNAGEKVEWDTLGAESGRYNSEVINGVTKSKIYDRSKFLDGYLIQCTNIYGELLPEINKSAWQDTRVTTESRYDIALEVDGDSLRTSTPGMSGASIVIAVDMSRAMQEDEKGIMLGNALEECIGGLSNNTRISFLPSNSGGADQWTDPQHCSFNFTQESFYSEPVVVPMILTLANDAFSWEKNEKKDLIFILGGRPDEQSLGFIPGPVDTLKNSGVEIHIIEIHDETDTGGSWISASYATKHYQITVDELDSTLRNIMLPGEATETLKNSFVYDTLSDKVELSGTKMWLSDNKVLNEQDERTPHLDKSKVLNGTLDNQTQIITYKDNTNAEVAWYYKEAHEENVAGELRIIPANTIKWKVKDLGKDETQTLIYSVKVTGEPLESYPDKPHGDTGTHALVPENGYYSNEYAYLVYNGGREKEFLHPVVRPLDTRPSTISLAVQKEIININDVPKDKQGTAFEIELSSSNVFKDAEKEERWSSVKENLVHNGQAMETGTLYLDSNTGVFEIKETENPLFELDTVIVEDEEGEIIDVEKVVNNGKASYKFTITTSSANKNPHITVTVKNKYKEQNPIRIQKFVDGKSGEESGDRTQFTITLTEVGSKETIRKVLAANDGIQDMDFMVPAEAKTYQIEETNIPANYVLDRIEAIDQVSSKPIEIQNIDGIYTVTVNPGSQPIIQVYNKKVGRIRVEKKVTGVNAPTQDFMIQIKRAGDKGTYVDAGAVLKDGEKSGWIVIDEPTTLEISETQLKEFDLSSMTAKGLTLMKINDRAYEVTVDPGQDYTVIIENTYTESPYFHAEDGRTNDFNKKSGSAKAEAGKVELAVERRFLITEQSVVLEPRELPERLL